MPYAQTEAYRFYDGPIEAVEGLINAWPIDENLIDYVDGEPDAGVINQVATYPRITSDLLASLNEKGRPILPLSIDTDAVRIEGRSRHDAGCELKRLRLARAAGG